MSARVLVARLDNDGDVLLAGPAVRAVAAGADEVTLLCGPRGQHAAALLPGVDELVVWHCPWIDPAPQPVQRSDVLALVDQLAERQLTAAVVLTSYHQSPLPLALVLRLAGVPRICAASEDYPGSLLDVRLAVRRPLPDTTALTGPGGYVVLHPGASVPARAWAPRHCAALVAELALQGYHVVVTGGPDETALTA